VVIETKQLITVALIVLEFSLKGDRVTSVHNIRRTAIDTVTVLGRHESLDVDAVLFVMNCFTVVYATTISACVLVLFDIDKDIVRETQMNEGIQSTAIGLERLSFSSVGWEIG